MASDLFYHIYSCLLLNQTVPQPEDFSISTQIWSCHSWLPTASQINPKLISTMRGPAQSASAHQPSGLTSHYSPSLWVLGLDAVFGSSRANDPHYLVLTRSGTSPMLVTSVISTYPPQLKGPISGMLFPGTTHQAPFVMFPISFLPVLSTGCNQAC